MPSPILKADRLPLLTLSLIVLIPAQAMAQEAPPLFLDAAWPERNLQAEALEEELWSAGILSLSRHPVDNEPPLLDFADEPYLMYAGFSLQDAPASQST